MIEPGIGMHALNDISLEMKEFMQGDDGISFIECALVASLVAVVVGIAVLALTKHD